MCITWLAILQNTEEDAIMKVKDLIVGELYCIDSNLNVHARLGPLGWLQIHRGTKEKWRVDARLLRCPKSIMVYLGRIISRVLLTKDHPVRETAHSFAIGERMVYIYGEHIRHVLPFTGTG